MANIGVNGFWAISSNVGDRITSFLIEQLTGRPGVWARPQPEKQLVGCGSILNHAMAKNIVWGAGLASFSDGVCEDADIRSVRGPLSRAVAMACGAVVPEIYGDPGLLVSGYVDRNDMTEGRIGIVPHYMDFQRAQWWYGDDDRLTIISPLNGVYDFLEQLTECEFVFSSSLHGCILADAYGIPNRSVRMGEDVGGDGMKFLDHDLAWHGLMRMPLDVSLGNEDDKHPLPLDDIGRMTEEYEERRKRLGARREAMRIGLFEACPFKTGELK